MTRLELQSIMAAMLVASIECMYDTEQPAEEAGDLIEAVKADMAKRTRSIEDREKERIDQRDYFKPSEGVE